MTPGQFAQGIQFGLRARQWEADVTYQKVFQSSAVRVTPSIMDKFLAMKAFPLCIIGIGSATHDPQVPALLDQQFDIIIATGVAGDEIGENAIIGGGRPVAIGQAGSGGRGITEIEVEFWGVVALMTQQQGVQIQANAVSAAVVTQVEGLGFVAWRQYSVRATCTTMRTYLGTTALTGSATGSGGASLAWAAAPTQWMTFAGAGGQVVRWAAGTTGPQTPTAGSAVGVGALTGVSTSVAISGLTPGTYTFSVFTMYNETGGASPDRYSEPNSLTIVVT